ncbi:MAG: phosphohistidine phosphatase SixA [Vulcanimicrobiaceae bacterium]
MAREAKTFAQMQLDLDVIVTSPLVRAKETAAIVAEELGLQNRLVEDARLGGGLNVRSLAAILNEYAEKHAIALVGHEPGMSQSVRDLTGARVDFKKGAFALVTLPDPRALRGTLAWLIPPKVLLMKGK